jgi:hypothetical protein
VCASEADREAFRDDRREESLDRLLLLRGDENDRLRARPPSSSSLDLSRPRLSLLLLEREYLRDRPSSLRSCLSPVARRTGKDWRDRMAGLLVSSSSEECLECDESKLSVRRRLGEGSGVSASLFMVAVQFMSSHSDATAVRDEIFLIDVE